MSKNIDISKHEDYKVLCELSYQHFNRLYNYNVYKNYKYITCRSNIKTGFFADIYQNGNDLIIVFRGTDSFLDGCIDIGMIAHIIPVQLKDARKLFEEMNNLKKDYPKLNIILTGHSLGGSLAQMIAAIYGVDAITFSAFGTSGRLSNYKKLYSNIINYGILSDYIFTLRLHEQIGDVWVVPSLTNKWGHFLENYDDLSNSVKINKKTAVTGFASDIRNGIDAIPTSCVGSYPVSGYTRSDGTKVSAYIRTCGAKHSKIPKLNNLSKEEIDEKVYLIVEDYFKFTPLDENGGGKGEELCEDD